MKPKDYQLIQQIAARATELYRRFGVKVKPQFIATELTMVHQEVFALRLKDLLDADDMNFAHDVAGIHDHLVYSHPATLRDCFVPRFAQ